MGATRTSTRSRRWWRGIWSRRAAIDQVEVMTAVMGEDRGLFRAPVGYFLPGTPSAWRKTLTGLLPGPVPVFWNVAKG